MIVPTTGSFNSYNHRLFILVKIIFTLSTVRAVVAGTIISVWFKIAFKCMFIHDIIIQYLQILFFFFFVISFNFRHDERSLTALTLCVCSIYANMYREYLRRRVYTPNDTPSAGCTINRVKFMRHLSLIIRFYRTCSTRCPAFRVLGVFFTVRRVPILGFKFHIRIGANTPNCSNDHRRFSMRKEIEKMKEEKEEKKNRNIDRTRKIVPKEK